jgi:hypothetical protein
VRGRRWGWISLTPRDPVCQTAEGPIPLADRLRPWFPPKRRRIQRFTQALALRRRGRSVFPVHSHRRRSEPAKYTGTSSVVMPVMASPRRRVAGQDQIVAGTEFAGCGRTAGSCGGRRALPRQHLPLFFSSSLRAGSSRSGQWRLPVSPSRGSRSCPGTRCPIFYCTTSPKTA